MITAIVLIDADVHQIPETAQAVADIPGVEEVYSCAGDVDPVSYTHLTLPTMCQV